MSTIALSAVACSGDADNSVPNTSSDAAPDQADSTSQETSVDTDGGSEEAAQCEHPSNVCSCSCGGLQRREWFNGPCEEINKYTCDIQASTKYTGCVLDHVACPYQQCGSNTRLVCSCLCGDQPVLYTNDAPCDYNETVTCDSTKDLKYTECESRGAECFF